MWTRPVLAAGNQTGVTLPPEIQSDVAERHVKLQLRCVVEIVRHWRSRWRLEP